MTEESGAQRRQQRSRADRLFGGAAEPATPRPARNRPPAPVAVRRAALVAGLEAALLLAVALFLLYLTLTSTPDSVARAYAEVVLVGGLGAGAAVAAAGLWRVSPWSRAPVVVLQLFLGLYGYTTAVELERPLLGVPALVLVAVELYLLATPAARLAFLERDDR